MHFFTTVDVVGDSVLCRGYKDGQPFKEDIRFSPTIYLPSKKMNAGFKSIEGEPLEAFQPGSISECSNFIRKYENVSNFKYHGMTDWKYSFIADYFKGEIKYDFDTIKLAYIDIETDSEGGYGDVDTANREVISVAIYLRGKYYILGLKDYIPTESNIRYVKCKDEKDLLIKLVQLWQALAFDIITGWNIEQYDIPYLVNRITRVLGKDFARKLSPWNILKKRLIPTPRGDVNAYDLFGIVILDYLPLFKKFSDKKPENFKLNSVAHLVLNETKTDYSQFKGLNDLYKKDFKTFIDYNINDVGLIVRIEESENLIDLAVNIAMSAKINIIDVFKQTRIWDAIIYNFLLDKKVIIPKRKPTGQDAEKIAGGAVRDPIPGLYDWAVSLDLTSLYPSLIMQYNIGPETLYKKIDEPPQNDLIHLRMEQDIEAYIRNNNLSLAANGAMFRKDRRSFIATITESYFKRRKEYKDQQLLLEKEAERVRDSASREELKEIKRKITVFKNFQLNYKIALNALYGSLSNAGFRFYDKRLGEAITLSGQTTIRYVIRRLNEYLNDMLKTSGKDYIIASDTDSVWVDLKTLVDKTGLKEPLKIVEFLHRFCKEKLQLKLQEWFQALHVFMNSYEQKMDMKREKICDKALWQAKKRYICSVWDKEGTRYDEPKLEVTGIEAIRSNTPEHCRELLKKSFKIIMHQGQDKLHDFVEQERAKFNEQKIEDIASPTGVKGLHKYADPQTIYIKGTPMHVRAALVYNNLIKDKSQEDYERIYEGDKIKFIQLKVPNLVQEDVIGFTTYLSPELGLHKYIDYEGQWQKAFLGPLQGVTDAIGWSVAPMDTVDSLFE